MSEVLDLRGPPVLQEQLAYQALQEVLEPLVHPELLVNLVVGVIISFHSSLNLVYIVHEHCIPQRSICPVEQSEAAQGGQPPSGAEVGAPKAGLGLVQQKISKQKKVNTSQSLDSK